MAADLERDDLQPYVRQLGGLDQGLDLTPHHGRAADRPAQRRLVHDRPQLGRVGPGEQLLPGDAAGRPGARPRPSLARAVPEQDDRAGVVRGLQQARHELHLVGADQRGGGLQAEVGLEPAGQHVAVPVPPAGGVRLAGQRAAGARAPVVVGDAVEA